jgi:rare lipoprotein A
MPRFILIHGLLSLAAVSAAPPGVARGERQASASGAHLQKGRAAFYSQTFDGHKTACGGTYSATEMTIAHRTLPCGTKVRITNMKNGKSVEATVNDRGPASHQRIVDVSRAVAEQLDFVKQGTATVEIEVLQ